MFSTPLELAWKSNNLAAVKILLKFGANAEKALEMIQVTTGPYQDSIIYELKGD